MWFFSQRMRREAKSRAPEYATYYVRQHGAHAAEQLQLRMKQQKRGSYYWLLYRYALQELKLRR